MPTCAAPPDSLREQVAASLQAYREIVHTCWCNALNYTKACLLTAAWRAGEDPRFHAPPQHCLVDGSVLGAAAACHGMVRPALHICISLHFQSLSQLEGLLACSRLHLHSLHGHSKIAGHAHVVEYSSPAYGEPLLLRQHRLLPAQAAATLSCSMAMTVACAAGVLEAQSTASSRLPRPTQRWQRRSRGRAGSPSPWTLPGYAPCCHALSCDCSARQTVTLA